MAAAPLCSLGFCFFFGGVVAPLSTPPGPVTGQDDRAVIGRELHVIRRAFMCVCVCVRETKSGNNRVC